MTTVSRPQAVEEAARPRKVEPMLRISGSVSLGTGPRNVPDILASMRDGRHTVGESGRDLLSQNGFVVRRKEKRVPFAATFVAGLGFPQGAIYRDILKAGRERGGICGPSETAVQLCIQGVGNLFGEISRGPCLFVAMKPIVGAKGRPHIFSMGCDERLSGLSGEHERRWLDAVACDDNQFFTADRLIVFLMSPRQR